MKFSTLPYLLALMASWTISSAYGQDTLSSSSQEPSSEPSSSLATPTTSSSIKLVPNASKTCTEGIESETPSLMHVAMPFVVPDGVPAGRVHEFQWTMTLGWKRCGSEPTQAA
ncbi:hypothetical protein QBC43DRAFT_287687 [Cladorrhinum sp. PSN259]|nr:hypothetical protein QBC43DRAFT_287687 [Cladorrhinum sp. PSN259]